jgi:hypothetical protein
MGSLRCAIGLKWQDSAHGMNRKELAEDTMNIWDKLMRENSKLPNQSRTANSEGRRWMVDSSFINIILASPTLNASFFDLPIDLMQ